MSDIRNSPSGKLATSTSDDIVNLSAVPGTNVSAALNALNSAGSTSDDVSNLSAVFGANVTIALNTLDGLINALTSDEIANSSSVLGATVTEALDNLVTGSDLPTEVITVPVPVLVADTLGYVEVTAIGPLAGIVVTDQVVGSPTADLQPPGVSAGFYAGCRVSAPNTIRMTFRGALTGGPMVDFIFTKTS